MFRLLNRFRKNDAGAAAIEMAFVLPLFLLFVLGIIEFGRAYWTLNSMQLAVDEAGRYAMVHTTSTDAQIVAAAQANLYGLNANNFTLTSASQTTGGVNYKVITATYVFSFVAPGVLPFGNLNLTRQTTVPLM
jgi:Flp pilus assembly protein TadG